MKNHQATCQTSPIKNFFNLKLLVLAATTLAATGVRASDGMPAAPRTYALRDVLTGSAIPKDIVTASVPFDKRYDELTADQKAVLWQDYESPSSTNETPFPESGLRHLVMPLVKLAERSSVTGQLVAVADIGPDGHARSVAIYKSPDPAMSDLAKVALAQEIYRPARCDAQPCAMSFVLRLDFQKL